MYTGSMAILQVSVILSAGEGELFAWGKNRVGTLGLAHNKDQFFPFKVSAAILFDALITHQTHCVVFLHQIFHLSFSVLKRTGICQTSQRQKWPPVWLYITYQW